MMVHMQGRCATDFLRRILTQQLRLRRYLGVFEADPPVLQEQPALDKSRVYIRGTRSVLDPQVVISNFEIIAGTRYYLVAVALNYLFQPVNHEEESLFVDKTNIPGSQPPFGI